MKLVYHHFHTKKNEVNETSDSNLLQSWSEFSQVGCNLQTLIFDKDNCRGVNISDNGLHLKNVAASTESNLSYALAQTGISKGFSRYQFKIDKDKILDEGVCIGITTKLGAVVG